jgi:hypothetical protein
VSTLERIQRFSVSRDLLAQTERALRRAGVEGYELFVLWSGIIDGSELVIRTCHVPKQTSSKTRRV